MQLALTPMENKEFSKFKLTTWSPLESKLHEYRSVRNFCEFHDKGRVRENLFPKFNMGGYKMAAFVKTDFR